MFCQKCGKRLLDGAKFCSYCGFRITYAAPVVPPNSVGERQSAENQPVAQAAAAQSTGAAPQPAAPSPAPQKAAVTPEATLTNTLPEASESTPPVPTTDETAPAAPATTPAAEVQVPAAQPEKKPRSKKRLFLLALASLVLIAGIITAVVLLTRKEPPDPANLTHDDIVDVLEDYCKKYDYTLKPLRETQSAKNLVIYSYLLTKTHGKLSIEITEKDDLVSNIQAHYNNDRDVSTLGIDLTGALIDQVMLPFYCCPDVPTIDEAGSWFITQAELEYMDYVLDTYTYDRTYSPHFEKTFASNYWSYTVIVDGGFVYMSADKLDGSTPTVGVTEAPTQAEPKTERATIPATAPPTEAIGGGGDSEEHALELFYNISEDGWNGYTLRELADKVFINGDYSVNCTKFDDGIYGVNISGDFYTNTLVFTGVRNGTLSYSVNTTTGTTTIAADEGILNALYDAAQEAGPNKNLSKPAQNEAKPTEAASSKPAATTPTEKPTVTEAANPCAIRHHWIPATCTEPAVCSVCGETYGSPMGHRWKDATCQAPQTCTVCGETTGTVAPHSMQLTRCSKCGYTDFSVLARSYSDVTCYDAKTGTDYEIQDVRIDSNGVLSFRFHDVTYNVTMVQRQYSTVFDCYVNGALNYSIECEAWEYSAGTYYINFTWDGLDGCKLYFQARS